MRIEVTHAGREILIVLSSHGLYQVRARIDARDALHLAAKICKIRGIWTSDHAHMFAQMQRDLHALENAENEEREHGGGPQFGGGR